VATDAPGVRSVLESAKLAKEKNLSLVAGLCWRYEGARREFYKKIHDGAIGEIRAIYATYYTGPVKPMPPASERPQGMGDLEWQMRHWYNFVWLSGDGLVEQAVHSVDKISWGMKDQPPLKAVAVGGRQTPNHQGNIYDHIFVTYEYPDDVRAFLGQRQITNCFSENADYLMGSEGFGKIPSWQTRSFAGRKAGVIAGEKTDMYQQEHNELFASIRSGKPMNDGQWMAQSTLMGIMARMAAYTGQEVTWEAAMNSQERLGAGATRLENETRHCADGSAGIYEAGLELPGEIETLTVRFSTLKVVRVTPCVPLEANDADCGAHGVGGAYLVI
jgi:predicted dehydrogenase